jgi:hypothetical protein
MPEKVLRNKKINWAGLNVLYKKARNKLGD